MRKKINNKNTSNPVGRSNVRKNWIQIIGKITPLIHCRTRHHHLSIMITPPIVHVMSNEKQDMTKH